MLINLKGKNNTHILDRREFRSALISILGFRPGKLGIYEKAFIHRSATLTLEDGTNINNERLEFLGDAILDAVLSEFFFSSYPSASEGEMTKLRSRIVNRDQLNHIATSIGINNVLVSHVNGTANTDRLYGDALEALIGSVFIDRGYARARKFIMNNIIAKHINIDHLINTESDYKSMIFMWAQKMNRQISFNFNEEYDPKNKRSLFTATLRVDHEIYGEGSGSSKKSAEKQASSQGWNKIIRSGYIE